MSDILVSKRIKKYLPVILIALGAFLRLFLLGVIPEGCEQDEAYSAWNAFSVYCNGIDSAGQSFPVYFEAWGHGQSALFTYLIVPFIALFGGHINLLAIRLPQALVSIAALVAVYFLMRELYDVNTALWALFLLAICPWHVIMSRWGLDANLAPGFLMIGFCFFVYSFRRPYLLLLAAFFYGLCLYSYALTWIMIPVILLLQGLYCLVCRKIAFSKWIPLAVLILGIMAFPLICFLLVNKGYLPAFRLGPFSIYKMTYYRGNEFAKTLSDMILYAKVTLKLLYFQEGPYAYDVLLPFGLFYRTGRIFVVIGIFVILYRAGRSVFAKTFCADVLLLIQLAGTGMIGALLLVSLSRINCLYIPLVLAETVGVAALVGFLTKRRRKAGYAVAALLVCLYLGELISFQKAYYTEYKEASSVWFYKGADEAVRAACDLAAQNERDICAVDLNYPNILLATETPAGDYLKSVVYSDIPPTPAQFRVGDVTFHIMGGLEDEADIRQDWIYVFTDREYDKFDGFRILKFSHWYVAY